MACSVSVLQPKLLCCSDEFCLKRTDLPAITPGDQLASESSFWVPLHCTVCCYLQCVPDLAEMPINNFSRADS